VQHAGCYKKEREITVQNEKKCGYASEKLNIVECLKDKTTYIADLDRLAT
jgi:uncharacterized protein related to proFAR isomerase